jgi:hypothetical protein
LPHEPRLSSHQRLLLRIGWCIVAALLTSGLIGLMVSLAMRPRY